MNKITMRFSRDELRFISKLLQYAEADLVKANCALVLYGEPVTPDDLDRVKRVKALSDRFFNAYSKACAQDLVART